MPTIGGFISELALVTGNKDLAQLQTFLANKDIADAVIPDEIANGIKGGMLTMESARHNADLKNHYTAQAYNGIDANLEKLLIDSGYSSDVITSVKEQKKTTDRIATAINKIKELEVQKINTSGGDKKALQEKIDELTEQVRNLNLSVVKEKENADKIAATKDREAEDMIKDFVISNHFMGYDYANEKMPKKSQVTFVKMLLQDKLKELGLKVNFDKQTGQVKLLTNTEQDYYKDNKPVTFEQFSDSLLADNHLLKINGQPKIEISDGKSIPKVELNNNSRGVRDVSKMASALETSLQSVSDK